MRRAWPPRIRILGATAVALALPLIVTFLLIRSFYGGPLTDYVPSKPNDEVAYWRQIATFSTSGFHGGYFTYNENPGPISIIRVGAHGIGIPLFYGTIARVTGWGYYSGPLINIGLLLAAMALFLALARLSALDTLLVGGLVATLFAVPFAMTTTTPEAFNLATGIVLAYPMARLIKDGRKAGAPMLWAVIGVVAVASLLRATWIVLVPVAVFLWLPTSRRSAYVAVATGAFGFVASYLAVFAVASPYPLGPHSKLETGVGHYFEALSKYVTERLPDGFSKTWHYVYHFPTNTQQLAYLMAVGIAIGSIAALVHHARRSTLTAQPVRMYGFMAWNLAVFLVLMLMLNQEGEYGFARLIAPHLLLGLLVLAVLKVNRTLLVGVLALQVLVMPLTPERFEYFRAPAFESRQSILKFQNETQGVFEYQGGRGPWCNTLLATNYTAPLLAVPKQLGISHLLPTLAPPTRPKSRYLLIDTEYDLKIRSRLKHLMDTSMGSLYLNFDAGCGDVEAPRPVQTCPCTTRDREEKGSLLIDGNSYELGLKFYADRDGLVTGVRFYKPKGMTGVHAGRLWTIDGRKLAETVFTNETDEGWQEQSFADPVRVQANVTYVISYSVPGGNYALTLYAFGAQTMDRPPLHVPDNESAGGNGVASEGVGNFPTKSRRASNYWVDVIFE